MDKSNRYNRKIRFLAGLVGVLALIYGATLLFDPEQMNTRNASFVWLEAKWVDQADRIELSGTEGEVTLIRKNNLWFVSRDTAEYPAKQLRIEDLLRLLSTRGSYLVRGTAASSHERLGLTLDTASRMVIRGGASTYPLLDLLVGTGDPTGQEIYLRKNGEPEVRSGADKFSGYINSRPTAWFNLRLFREEDYPGLKSESVQRVTVYGLPSPNEEDEAPAAAVHKPKTPLILTRNEGTWTISGAAITKADPQRVESYIRSILEAEGEDFLSSEDVPVPEGLAFGLNPDSSSAQTSNSFNEGRILLELGNGQTLTINVGPPLPSNQRSVQVEGSLFTYILAEWTLGRIFKADSYFE